MKAENAAPEAQQVKYPAVPNLTPIPTPEAAPEIQGKEAGISHVQRRPGII